MKKLNKLFAILVAMAMVLSLSVIAAFADTQTTALDSSKITKKWAIPEGVADPSLTTSFTFTANRAKSAGVTEDETLPSVATVDAAYNNAQDATHDVLTAGKTVSQDYAIPAPTGVTHAGVYAFDVVETQPVIVAPNIENDSVKKDNTQYRVRYYYENQKVKTSEEGVTPETFENRVVLTGITVAIVNGEDESKISPTPGTDGSAFKFNNVYEVTNGEEQPPEGPIDLDKVALKVTKAVDGKDAPDDATFPFTVTLTAAEGQELSTIKAYVYNIVDGTGANDTRVDSTPAGELTPDAQGVISVNLKANQALAFLQLPTGTRYKVSEDLNGAPAYTAFLPEYVVTSTGSAANATFTEKGSAGVTLLTKGEAATGTYLIGTNVKDAVAYTNVYDEDITTPTGILISNLPYIALALVAIGGLVAYVVVRRRQSDEA